MNAAQRLRRDLAIHARQKAGARAALELMEGSST